ncbi:MAG: hypothetical protein JO215_10795 [Ktedonobacteraceae bacterium]|nr:hypothetical protein [Ktedonobacteraceae bacterium]
MTTNVYERIDICILCALAEEADRLKEAFQGASANIFKEQPLVEFKQRYNPNLRRNYDYAIITNRLGEQLGVLVTWLADNGPMETGLQLHPLLKEFKPRFAAMSGICAGDREKVKLGDIIVASRTFLYDVGKIVEGKDGHPELRPDTPMWSLPTEVLQAVRGFNAWKQVVEIEARPPSMHQQRDWLLYKLLDPNVSSVDEIPQQELEEHVPDWRMVLQELRKGDSDAYLTRERTLKDPARVRDLRYEVVFPFKDAPQPTVHIAPMASGSTVRADNPFNEIRIPVRGTLAVEMEGAAFYRTLQEFGGTQYLVVKGVCDYADKDKDDSYHNYAGRISALYLLAFLRDYVTSERFPDVGRKVQVPSPSVTNIQTPETSSVQEPHDGLNLFYSYAPEDEDMRTKLAKHLVMLKTSRGGPVRELYTNKVGAGLSNDAIALLESSQIILLLISSDFMATDDLYSKELKRAFELQAAGKARIVPVLLHPTDLKGTPLAGVVVLPKDKVPISEARSKDAAYVEVVKEIRAVVEDFKKSRLQDNN